jgi:hypothetical protein
MTLLADIGDALRGALADDVLPAATLHVVTETLNDYGTPVRTLTDHVGQGFVSDWKAEVMAVRGYAANTAKVVLVQDAALPRPKLGDEITAQRPINGTMEHFRVTDVTSDPADATWQVAGVKI